MHNVLAIVVGLDWLEGADTDMEGDERGVDAAVAKAIEQARREVQTGRRRRDGARLTCEDGLVAVRVPRVGAAAADVRRQRHMTVAFEERRRRSLVIGSNTPASRRKTL